MNSLVCRLTFFSCSVVAGMTLSACNSDSSDADDKCGSLRKKSLKTLSKTCESCHSASGSASKTAFVYAPDVNELISDGMIKPGNSAGSPLFVRMANNTMPPANVSPRPSEGDMANVEEWIDTCLAEQFRCEKPFIPIQAMLSYMVNDIGSINVVDRPFIRYFTLTHISNVGACQPELDDYRFALRRTVNNLSTEPAITWPEPIDAESTIYRIDIRDYGWNANTWRNIVDENPFAIEYLEDDADLLKLFTEEDVPFVLGDWFVNASLQPPLYYDILDIPGTLGGLENDLNIDIQDNIEAGEVERAGFLDSGISEQNRIIERHQLPFARDATFWISYDFGPEGNDKNVFANPLDFNADGSEMIWSLPNGLHAYSIVDAAGRRLDAAPDDIVVDPHQPDANVISAISCIGCHDKGMIVAEDEIREFVLQSLDFNLDEKDAVEELHPVNSNLKARLESDQEIFLEAIDLLEPPVTLRGDGVSTVYFAFDESLDLRRAASEFGITADQLLERLPKLNPDLAPLATESIKRDLFTEHFAESVCLLKIGLADDRECD